MSIPGVKELIPISHQVVAIGFFDDVPSNVPKWRAGPVPAGCTFWGRAMKGEMFYTSQEDHYNCAVGAHTHGIQQPPERAAVLEDTVGFMVGNGYIEMAEIPGIPVLSKAPRYIAYAPVEHAPFEPNLVLIAAKPYAAMLVYEAAVRAGAGAGMLNVLGRPGCAVLPLAHNTAATALSFGCKGNRTFTGLPDEEMYICVPGIHWSNVVTQLASINAANSTMEQYYRQHQSQFPILQ